MDFFAWGAFGKHPAKVSPADAVVGSNVPVLLIHGEKDSQISVENSKRIKAANDDVDFWLVEGAEHGYAHAMFEKQYEKKVKDFLKAHMK